MAENQLYKTALNKAMAQCSRREYCREDLRSKILSWGLNDNDAEKIIDNLVKDNFLNENRYASAFVRDKFRYNKWGKVKIAAHLRAKKLPSDIIKQALDSIDDNEYFKMLSDLISSHRRSVKARNPYELKAKLVRFGLSKGFESSLLYDLLNENEY